MDGQRFDELARSVAAGTSRRQVLRGLAAAAVAALLGGLGPDAAAAHDTLGRCRKIEDRQKRAACVKKAKRHNRQHATPPPPPPPPPPPATGCTIDGDCDDGDPCTEDVCVVETGECRHDAIPGCGGDACVCSLTAEGEPCGADAECCTGYCGAGGFLGQSVCTYGERRCAGEGAFCANDASGENACCTGVCENCACACLAPGAACATDASCCGICAADGCCREVDARCTDDADCCSGVCTSDGYDDNGVPVSACDRGPAGTACRSAGACQSGACCNGVCCPACGDRGAYCAYDDASNQEVCACYP